MQISWNKPPAKYKIFGYRVFVKWSTLDQGENMLALYDGNKTGFIYTLDKNNPSSLTFHVMAHVISEIPLIPVLGKQKYTILNEQCNRDYSVYAQMTCLRWKRILSSCKHFHELLVASKRSII